MPSSQTHQPRLHSHGMTREPLLEPFLAQRRYRFSLGVVKKLVKSGMTVKGLDLGCGYRGNFVHQARKLMGVDFYGGDLIVNPHDAQLLTFDFSAPPPLPYKPNVVTMHAVMEHLPEPEAAVRYVHDVLEPGGFLLFTAPSNLGKPVLEFLSFRLGIVSRQEIEDHKQYFNRASSLALLNHPQARFQDVRHEYFQLGMNNRVVAQKALSTDV